MRIFQEAISQLVLREGTIHREGGLEACLDGSCRIYALTYADPTAATAYLMPLVEEAKDRARQWDFTSPTDFARGWNLDADTEKIYRLLRLHTMASAQRGETGSVKPFEYDIECIPEPVRQGMSFLCAAVPRFIGFRRIARLFGMDKSEDAQVWRFLAEDWRWSIAHAGLELEEAERVSCYGLLALLRETCKDIAYKDLVEAVDTRLGHLKRGVVERLDLISDLRTYFARRLHNFAFHLGGYSAIQMATRQSGQRFWPDHAEVPSLLGDVRFMRPSALDNVGDKREYLRVQRTLILKFLFGNGVEAAKQAFTNLLLRHYGLITVTRYSAYGITREQMDVSKAWAAAQTDLCKHSQKEREVHKIASEALRAAADLDGNWQHTRRAFSRVEGVSLLTPFLPVTIVLDKSHPEFSVRDAYVLYEFALTNRFRTMDRRYGRQVGGRLMGAYPIYSAWRQLSGETFPGEFSKEHFPVVRMEHAGTWQELSAVLQELARRCQVVLVEDEEAKLYEQYADCSDIVSAVAQRIKRKIRKEM